MVLAAAATGEFSASRERAAIMQALGLAPTAIGSLDIDPWNRRILLRQVAFLTGEVRITIGRLEVAAPSTGPFSLVGSAAAAVATVTAHDLRIEVGDSVLSIPRIEAHGTKSSGIDLARLFDPDSPKPLADRLAKLSFGSIVVPEITMTRSGADHKNDSMGLHGLALTDVVNGRIGSLAITGADMKMGPAGETSDTASVGSITASGIDLPLAASIAEGTRTEASAPLRPIYDSVLITAIKAGRSATDGFEIGAIQSAALQGRPLTITLKQANTLLSKSKSDLSDAERSQQTAVLADALQSFSLGRFEVRDFNYAKTGAADATSMKLGRLLIDGFATFRSHTIAIEHFLLADKDVRLSFSRSALDGLDGSGLVDVVSTANGPTDRALTPDQIRKVAPKLADASLLDLEVEVPVADATGNIKAGTATLFKVPVAEMRAGGFVGNLASDVSSHMEALYDVASPAPGSNIEDMSKAGFGHLDMSSDYAATWNSTTQDFRLGQFSLAAKDLASVSLGGLVSNMSPDLMSPDKAVAQHAVDQLRLKTLTLAVVNSGLAEKGLPLAATSMSLSVADLKTQMTSQAREVIGQVFGPGANADQLSGAVASFIDQPKSLSISVRAPQGLSLAAVQAMDNPQDLLKQLEVTAVANH